MTTIPASRQPKNRIKIRTTEPMAIARCSINRFTALLAFSPSLRVTTTSILLGNTPAFSTFNFSNTRLATSTALVPGFLAKLMVTADWSAALESTESGPKPIRV